VNGHAIETTIQRLISSGMDPKTENNPYMGFVYTSFQERATKVTHGNTARLAKNAGDETLAKLTGLIAADEGAKGFGPLGEYARLNQPSPCPGRHEVAYQRIVEELAKRDPKGVVLALASMMRKTIVMPAHRMDDGEHEMRTGHSLFSDYAAVAESLGVYTPFDYADIMDHCITRWNVGALKVGETGEAADEQAWLMAQPERVRRLATVSASRKAKKAPVTQTFSWVFNRPVLT
jgi:acyl-[acyl-carrier-protein] desaturase